MKNDISCDYNWLFFLLHSKLYFECNFFLTKGTVKNQLQIHLIFETVNLRHQIKKKTKFLPNKFKKILRFSIEEGIV